MDRDSKVVVSASFIGKVREVIDRAQQSGSSPERLIAQLEESFKASEIAPYEKPTIVVEVWAGVVQGTIANVDCAVQVFDYDTDGGCNSIEIPPGADGETRRATIEQQDPGVDPQRVAEMTARKPMLDSPRDIQPGEAGVYLLTLGGGVSQVRIPVREAGGVIVLGEAVAIGDEEFSDAETISAELILADGREITVSGDWHRDMEDRGYLPEALFMLEQGATFDEAADGVRMACP